MVLTDSHTHLYLQEFKHDIDEVIKRATANNITRFFLPNIDSSSVNNLLNLQNKFPDKCFPMMGLHPCSVKENFEEELKVIINCLQKEKFYAIGEIGIDLYWDKIFIEEQKEAFRRQINLSEEFNLPIVIHCRNSFDEIIIEIEKISHKPRGIFHCFSGNIDQAQKAIELGFYLGIGGVVTFKNAGLDAVIREIDINHIVLETDSPYLAPVPFRGKRNESSYLIYIAQKIAELKKISVDKVAEVTTNNSKQIFKV